MTADEATGSGQSKQAVRERVWAALADSGHARFPGTRGRIPNFVGAEAAAAALAATDAWRGAETMKANPDAPQLPVRSRALTDGKCVYMAVPRLRDPRPFLLLDPAALQVRPRAAASIRGSALHGRPTAAEEVGPLDLVVCGTVAVNRQGVRVGKGGGYSDLELALLCELGAIGASTVVATTVHDLQLLDEPLPETDHDFRVDLVVTPSQIVETPGGHRPGGILWDHLDEAKIASIPVLAARAPRR